MLPSNKARKPSLFASFTKRRDSNLKKRRESKHIENPTALDVRKMLMPVRMDVSSCLSLYYGINYYNLDSCVMTI